MTDQNTTQATAETAAEMAVRKINAAEIVGGMQFVTKLAAKLVKDYPSHTPSQIADAIEAVFAEKLKKMETRLQNVEKIRADYNALKSAQPVVADTVAMINKLSELDYVDHAAKVPAKGAPAKAGPKVAIKANGAAEDSAQMTLM